jgi:ATP-dependent DNA helicase RecG
MRVADEDRQLSARELEKIIVNKNQERLRWDNQPCSMSVDELDNAKLRDFVERAGLKWDTPLNALDKLGLLRHGQMLNAARLFFTDEPMELRCAVFGTTDSAMIIDRHDIQGNILELIEEAQKYVLKNIHIGMRLEGLYRKDVPEIATEAMREAIINAFCHRDYRDPDYIQVAIYKNRVEIRNPGSLFGGITIETLRKGHVSKRRNPLIADLFRRIEMVEAWGRGMPLILKYEPDVQFLEMADIFIAAFGRPSYQSGFQEEHSPVKKAKSTGHSSPKSSVKSSVESSVKTSVKILNLLGKNSDMTIPELAERTGITTRGVEKNIRTLQENGVLKRIGPAKGGHWEVLK